MEQPPRNTKEKIDHWFSAEHTIGTGAEKAMDSVVNIIGTAAREIVKRPP